jgi:hypothetical protein
VGPYYSSKAKPVKLLADPSSVRAWPGGVGNVKVGGNYAPTIDVGAKAMEKGYQQVLVDEFKVFFPVSIIFIVIYVCRRCYGYTAMIIRSLK